MLVGGATAITAPPLAPAATLTAGIIGTTAFSIGHMTKLEAGSLAIKLRRLRDDEGNPLDPQLIRTFSLAYGAVSGALEAVEVNILLKTIPGLDKIMKDIVQNSVTKLMKNGSVGSFLLGAASRYAKFLGKEIAIEVAQEGASIVLEEVAKDTHELVTDGVIDDATFEEIITQIKDTAFSSLLGFGALGAPSHMMQTLPGLINTRSQVKEKRLQDVLPEDKEINFDKELKNTFERVKNVFFTQRDVRLYKNKNEGRVLNEEIRNLVQEGQTFDEVAAAMQLYRDSKNNPEAVEAALRGERIIEEDEKPVSKDFAGVPIKEKKVKKLTKPLSETKTRLIDMSKILTKEQKEFVDNIGTMYDEIADEALGDEVIFNTQNNFVNRSWIRKKKTQDMLSRLTQTTMKTAFRRIILIAQSPPQLLLFQ